MYIARNQDRLLHLFEEKPIKTIYGWYSPTLVTTLPSYIFTEIKWEDEEPRELILK